MNQIDFGLVATLSAWTIACVAASRKVEHRIDGWLVFVVALVAALIGAFAVLGAQYVSALQHAGIAWIGAIGSVQFADRALDRIRK